MEKIQDRLFFCSTEDKICYTPELLEVLVLHVAECWMWLAVMKYE